MRLRSVFTFALLALLSTSLLADQITLKNGDRLTGTVVKSDGKTLLLHTDAAGDVTVNFDAIESIQSDKDLHIGLKDGKTIVGPVSTSGDNLEVVTKTAGTAEAPKGTVTIIRNDAEQTAYEKTLHPGMLQGWNGGLNVGFALTRGNSATKNLNVAFTATRQTLHDKLGLYANSIYATNDVKAASPSTTANAVQGGARYDHNLTSRVFAFANADFQTDDLQGLNLRSVFGGGLGLHAIKSDATTLDLLAGANYTHESYTVFSRNLAALTLGEEFMHKLHASTVLKQSVYFYPNLSHSGEYRGTFNFGTVTKLNKWLGWQNSFGDIYVTNPPNGTKKNDLLFSTGINIAFTH